MTNRSFFTELRRRHVFRVGIAYVVTAWLLLQLGAIVFPVVHAPSWCEGVLLAFLVLGFPLALFLAWAFEVTPEGVRRTAAAEAEQARPPEQRRRVGQVLNMSIILVLAAAVGALLWRQFGTRPEAQTAQVAVAATAEAPAATSAPAAGTVIPAKSIAVLPFENLSPDPNNAYFAAGMQDMILTKLAEVGGLRVIARTSTESYASHPGNLPEIARELRVATILEGSVQKAGDQVLINVQLIDARSDEHLWAQSYQRTLTNIFGVEGEVAAKVATALSATLTPGEQAQLATIPTDNPAAYDAYLRGVAQEASTPTFGLFAAARSYAQAVKLDPGFALAWAALSSSDSTFYFLYIDYTPARLARAKQALDTAVALAPDAPATLIALGDYRYHGLRDYAPALAAYRKVLAAAPNNADALANIGYVERRLGRWREAADDLERSLVLDPRNLDTIFNLADTYRDLRRFDKAEELYRRGLAIRPGDPVIASGLATVYQAEGRLDDAERMLNSVTDPQKNFFAMRVLIQQALLTRRYNDAIHLLSGALAAKPPDVPSSLQAEWHGGDYRLLGFARDLSGDHDAARRAYQQAIVALRQVKNGSNIPRVLATIALAQAGLGEKAAALATARKAVALLPTSHDAYEGPNYEAILAQVQAQVGNHAEAIAAIKRMLSERGGDAFFNLIPTPALLRSDPVWDPLRKDPAFQALLNQQASRAPSAASTD